MSSMIHKVVFWPVDVQRDFIDDDGKLTVKAKEIRENIQRLSFFATKHPDIIHVIGSVDAHSSNDPEFQQYPEHCVRGTPGQLLIPEMSMPDTLFVRNEPYTDAQFQEIVNHKGPTILEKQNIDVFTAQHTKRLLEALDPDWIIVYGVCTDICVDRAVRGLLSLGHNVVVVSDAVKELNGEAALKCVEEWRKLDNARKVNDSTFSLWNTEKILDNLAHWNVRLQQTRREPEKDDTTYGGEWGRP